MILFHHRAVEAQLVKLAASPGFAAAEIKGPEASLRVRPMPFQQKNKHLLLSCDTNPRFHGGSFGF